MPSEYIWAPPLTNLGIIQLSGHFCYSFKYGNGMGSLIRVKGTSSEDPCGAGWFETSGKE